MTPRSPTRKLRATSLARIRVAVMSEKVPATTEPHSSALRPARLSSIPEACSPLPTLSTSAQATPSGYGRSDCDTSARRSGIEYMTPRIPPRAQMANETQYGKPVHQPIMTMPGSTKMMDEMVPAAEATVCTMLFSRIEVPRRARSTAIEITAAGIEVAKVSPALSPK